MDVWNDRIIDMGLNILEYLVAGGLGMLIYSVFGGRQAKPADVAAPVPVSASNPSPVKPSYQPGVGLDCEFVSFSPAPPMPEAAPSGSDAPPTASQSGRRRDRQEIIRMAREMLKSGTAGDLVKRSLPISEGELALLQNGNLSN